MQSVKGFSSTATEEGLGGYGDLWVGVKFAPDTSRDANARDVQPASREPARQEPARVRVRERVYGRVRVSAREGEWDWLIPLNVQESR
jgi:hypothetical protein